ncbi:MAG: GMC family oxidoreductase [Halioglobus sp.]
MNETTDFDAIVVGSGITGGWAAKELTERGLKVLVLERGSDIQHGRDYQGEHMPSWDIPFRGKPLRELYEEEYSVQSRCYAFDETNRQFWNNDKENPYVPTPDKPFMWQRADVVGGRSLIWGRQSYRWSEQDFLANKQDGHGVDWPIRYRDLEPWYRHVEDFIGVSGQAEGLSALPDSDFLPAMELNVVEKKAKARIEEEFPERTYTIGRTAILTEPKEGRGTCHYCGPCERGCSVGAYFSSQSSTLPAAKKTGNLTLLPDSVVHSLEYSENEHRVSGVRVIDAHSGDKKTYRSKLVFLCASTVASAQILLNSKSAAFPNGLANRSGVVGHYLMDHAMGPGAIGVIPGYEEYVEYGNRPTGGYVPRFRNVDSQDKDTEFLRGYGYQVYIGRGGWKSMYDKTPGFGESLKTQLRSPGPWTMFMLGYSECLPQYDNAISLDERKLDRFGIPQIRFDFSFGSNEDAMIPDMTKQAAAMIRTVGGVEVMERTNRGLPGEAIHEMGTVRMGRDPATSALNAYNQTHDVPNLFVTDGSCMTSSSCVNPSLTYMAITARAVDIAVGLLREGKV